MKETSTDQIGFEKQIWNAACLLRGNMDVSQYKMWTDYGPTDEIS